MGSGLHIARLVINGTVSHLKSSVLKKHFKLKVAAINIRLVLWFSLDIYYEFVSVLRVPFLILIHVLCKKCDKSR